MKRKGIVTVELALATAFVIVPMLSIGVLLCKGTYRKARCELAASVAIMRLERGHTQQQAQQAAQQLADTINGQVTIDSESVTVSSSITVMRRTIPIVTTLPR